MIDLVYLRLIAGDGGDGRVSFYRARGITKGGPNGGDGGRGGDIILRGSSADNTLRSLSGIKEIKAQKGQNGTKFNQTGSDGEDKIIDVPLGTIVWLTAENEASLRRRQKVGLSRSLKRDEATWRKFYLEKEGQAPPPRQNDFLADDKNKIEDFLHDRVSGNEAIYQPLSTGKILQLAVFEKDGQEVTICQGGFGGRGNDAFKNSTNRTPLEAEFGTTGEQKAVFLEARSLADIGLVGLPNAGKSSLLSRLTDAQPKVANYPFTTLEPNLGVINFGSATDREAQGAVVADIPGLIAGASEGKGLGFNFLRHVENCRVLAQVVALEEGIVFDENLSQEAKSRLLLDQVGQIRQELHNYQTEMSQKKIMLVINKIDLYSPELTQTLRETLHQKYPQESIILTSAATGEGLEELRQVWQRMLFTATE